MSIRYNNIRPCHFVGQLFLAAKDHTLSVDEIEHALRNNERYCLHVDRISTLIWNLESDPTHGGSEFQRFKIGRRTIGYRLLTPERLNANGQNITNLNQHIAELKANGLSFVLPKSQSPTDMKRIETMKLGSQMQRDVLVLEALQETADDTGSEVFETTSGRLVSSDEWTEDLYRHASGF